MNNNKIKNQTACNKGNAEEEKIKVKMKLSIKDKKIRNRLVVIMRRQMHNNE